MTETLSTSKEVPKIKPALQEKYDQEKKEESHAKRLDEHNIQEVADQLPEPVGYRLLVLPFTPKEKTKGGNIYYRIILIVFAENIDIPYEVITWPRRHGEERGSLPDIWRTASRHSHALGKGTFSQTTGLSLRPHGVPYSLPEQQRFASLVWQHQHGSHQAFPWQMVEKPNLLGGKHQLSPSAFSGKLLPMQLRARQQQQTRWRPLVDQ